MNTTNRILLTSTLAVTLALISQAKAFSQNNIAASPKVQAALADRTAAISTPAVPGMASHSSRADLAASPKLQQALQDRATVSRVAPERSTVVSYAAGGTKDVVASPKLREQLAGRQTEIRIAPLK